MKSKFTLSCKGCGHVQNKNNKFCEKCGQKQATPVVVPSAQTSLACTNCGSALESGDKFCENCGYKVLSANTSPPTQGVIATPPLPSPVAPSTLAAYKPLPPPAQPIHPAPQPPVSQPINNQSRMPLIFLLDTSASSSSFIRQLNSSLNNFKSDVCQDPQTQAILDVAVIQFGDNPHVLQQYTPVEKMKPVRLISGGQSMFSNSLREAVRLVTDYTNSMASTYKPWVILISGGTPVDNIDAAAMEVKNLQEANKLRLISIGVQGCNIAVLKQITDVVFRLDGTDFTPFFSWISKCMWAIAQTAPNEKPKLPALEGNIYREK